MTPDADGRTRYRWTIVALLFVATTINYVDRQVLGILAPTLSRALHWSETDYGDIVSWFSLAYALGFLVAGRLIDRVGVKRGLGAAVVVWSLAAMAHAFVATAAGFAGPARSDHGRMIWGEQGRAGYGLHDRALGATYLLGLWEGLERP